MELKGKTAFVSGGGKNIGRAIVLELAEMGANVVINGASDEAACTETAAAAEAFGVETMVHIGNIGDAKAVAAMAAATLERFGAVDILVNNAAIRPEKPFLELTLEDWQEVINIDLNASFYTARTFLPAMVDRGWGRIINFAGMNAIHGYKGRAPVSVSKHGVWGLTKSLAKEFGPAGITTNTISPGPTNTAHADEAMNHHIQSMVGRVPVGRLGRPTEIAGLCGYLCGSKGGFANGQMFAINGGAET
ncbi:MAG: 3-oxoacyl-ACP reductase [Nisaea sp.]|nr:3-oxoacyl-ACP reductase [Nisaea sp.]OUX97991.1 MAG: 3-oxoacyl-ACP reductase [Candidatus Endolissoclinum sp. TMED26]